MTTERICIITGGGSGIGRETALLAAEEGFMVILAGRTVSKLTATLDIIENHGGKAKAFQCDISDLSEVKALAEFSQGLGQIERVFHIAGVSPHMGNAEQILKINALGTINMHCVFINYLTENGCLIDTSSTSAYLTPRIVMPRRHYKLIYANQEKCLQKIMRFINLFPKSTRSGLAYAISKDFVIWLAKDHASDFGKKKLRVLSITPGNFETPMGKLEEQEADKYLKYNAIKRPGKPLEIAKLYMSLSDKSVGYLTGTDILCDGGCIAGGAKVF
ncbi:SDR family NAD(P)-dependent oxidoreductase [Streptococcus sp. S784/96/1]|uniref:SDR family NAD(P)-dependent oxidoreductase n=1 Tax=Streptococcus sp. S784/96/1 TaxID=2653499 RepID=UPI00138697DA|nr:SDR family oxidoreductase [Streptococcus sp. S784/96/1]